MSAAAGATQPPVPGAGPDPVAGAQPRALDRSGLLSALPRMIRTTSTALPAILTAAVLQAALTFLNAQSGPNPAFLLSAAVSALVALLLYAALTASALVNADATRRGALTPEEYVAPRMRRNLGRFTFWAILQWLAILLVSVVSAWLIPLVAVATPYLPLAAMDGRSNPLRTSLRAIRERPGRWLLTCLVLLVLGLVLFLLSVANTLFVTGAPAAFLFWTVLGVVAWWVLTAWALLFRDTHAGALGDRGASA